MAAKTYPEIINVLLNAGADVMAKDGGGNTPLHHTVQWNTVQHGNKTKIIETLLQASADENQKIKPRLYFVNIQR